MHENREISRTSCSKEQDRSAKAINQTADMHVPEKSDCAVVPVNQSNREAQASAEAGEGRAQTKENIVQSHMRPTQSGQRVSQGLHGVRQAARTRKQERFTALLHHLNVGLLRDSFYALKRQASPGVDGVTWQEYETGLEDRLIDLHNRVHRGAYRAKASRRVYIPKADGQQRPLGIAALEEKIVQQAGGDDSQPDLRGRLQRLLVWVSSRSQPASSAGCADGGHPVEASELGARCGHSWFLRQHEPRVDYEVHRAPRGRSPDASPDPEMVAGGSFGRWSVVGDDGRYTARSSCFTAAR